MDGRSEGTAPASAGEPGAELGAELRREIAGQQDSVARTLEDAALNRYLDRLARAVRDSGELLVTGMGASLHAGSIVAGMLRGHGLRATALPSSELLYYGERLPVKPVLVISQSGASVEIERLLELSKEPATARTREHVHGLTLDPDSPLGRHGAGVIPGGPERAFAATRSFTTTLAALYGLAMRLGVAVDLHGLPDAIGPALGELEHLGEARARLETASTIFVTGRGPLHGLADYVALLLMELARLPCAGIEAAQFRHGPREAAGRGLAVVALSARSDTSALVRRFAAQLAALDSPTVLLDAGSELEPGAGPMVKVPLPPADEVAAVLPMAVAAQRLAVALAEARGVTPGVPLRSSKVTREE